MRGESDSGWNMGSSKPPPLMSSKNPLTLVSAVETPTSARTRDQSSMRGSREGYAASQSASLILLCSMQADETRFPVPQERAAHLRAAPQSSAGGLLRPHVLRPRSPASRGADQQRCLGRDGGHAGPANESGAAGHRPARAPTGLGEAQGCRTRQSSLLFAEDLSLRRGSNRLEVKTLHSP